MEDRWSNMTKPPSSIHTLPHPYQHPTWLLLKPLLTFFELISKIHFVKKTDME